MPITPTHRSERLTLRRIVVLAAAVSVALVVTPAPARAGQAASAQPASPSEGWRTTVYPIYAWLPAFGAEVRLPEVPCDDCGDGGTVVPGGKVSSNWNGAAFAGLLVENRWIQAEANFLWAGLSAEKERPNLRVEASTVLGGARVGVRVAPDLFVGGGVRRIALDVKARAFEFDEVEWEPGLWQGIVGASFTPQLSARWRLLARADYGGFGTDDHSATANVSLEWHPGAHLVVNLGYGVLDLEANGTLLQKPIQIKQTLHGPIVGLGFWF